MTSGTILYPDLPTGVYLACHNTWKSCVALRGGGLPSSACAMATSWRAAWHCTKTTPGMERTFRPASYYPTMALCYGAMKPDTPQGGRPDTSMSCPAWSTRWHIEDMLGSRSIAGARSPIFGRFLRRGGQRLPTIPMLYPLPISVCSGHGSNRISADSSEGVSKTG